MKEYKIDLHLHSVLSPCGGDDMLPPQVISQAVKMGYDAIALTDHNSAENVAAFMAKGQELGLQVIAGMELQTNEDIHLVCLFESVEKVLVFQEAVYQQLPPLQNNKVSLGEQWVVDKEGTPLYEVERLLLVGTALPLEDAVKMVHQFQGLCLAAHIDRQSFSLWGTMGGFPPDLGLDGVELTYHLPRNPVQLEMIKQEGYQYVMSSDAHYIGDIKSPGCFAYLEECTIKELKKAFLGSEGRYIRTSR